MHKSIIPPIRELLLGDSALRVAVEVGAHSSLNFI